MKILHLCLACFYIDGYNYQENILPRIDIENGHEVLVIASTQMYINNQCLGYVSPGEYITEDGIHVVRIPYKNLGISLLTRKIRAYEGLYERIADFKPDIIMSHDLTYASINDVVRYKRNHPDLKLYADSHSAEYNSGRNWISLHILHRMIYKNYVQKAIPFLEKYYYIGVKEKEFSIKNYKVPDSIMEYFPLGGMIQDEAYYNEKRKQIRHDLKIQEDELLLVHSGKLVAEKRTEELIRAFQSSKVKGKLIILGSIPDHMNEVLRPLFCDNILYLGWKESEELVQFLCAADLYCQPGDVSATLQQAICCNCPVLSYPHEEYRNISMEYKCFIFCDSVESIREAFDSIASKRIELSVLEKEAKRCAENLLDYRRAWSNKMPSEYCANGDSLSK